MYEDLEFKMIINKIINNRKFKQMKNVRHHILSNTYDHCYLTAWYTYKVCKKLKLDYKSATKAALIHDFFFRTKGKLDLFEFARHPKYASKNASKIMKLNNIEKNCIESHMFPFCLTLPKYKESVIVNLMDDFVSFKDIKLISKIAFKRLQNVLSFALFIVINFIH